MQEEGRQPVEVDLGTPSELGAGVVARAVWLPGNRSVVATAEQVVVVPGWGPADRRGVEGPGVQGTVGARG